MDPTTNDHSIEVGFRELKNQLSHYIDQLCAGTQIIVTEHGKLVASLTARQRSILVQTSLSVQI